VYVTARILKGHAMGTTAKDLFDIIPPDTFNFFEGKKITNPKKVTDFGEYKNKEVSEASNIPLTSIRWDGKMLRKLKQRVEEWANAINLVGSYFKDEEKNIQWFKTNNPALGNYSPQMMIRMGRFHKLLKFIQNVLAENNK
jgi:hypothetical protein